jgi:hypothetical protein
MRGNKNKSFFVQLYAKRAFRVLKTGREIQFRVLKTGREIQFRVLKTGREIQFRGRCL